MLGETAAKVFGFDVDKVSAAAEQIGPFPPEVLTPPESDLYPVWRCPQAVALRLKLTSHNPAQKDC